MSEELTYPCPACRHPVASDDKNPWVRCGSCGSDVNMAFLFDDTVYQTKYNVTDGKSYQRYLERTAFRESSSRRLATRCMREAIPTPVPGPGTSVLEIGAGNFGMAMFLRDKGADVTVLDRTDFSDVPAGIRFVNADICGWAPPRTYDLVLASFVIEHTQDAPAMLTACYNALAGGGELVICYPVRDCLEVALFGYAARFYRPEHTFIPTSEFMLGMLELRRFHVDRTLRQCSPRDLFGVYHPVLQRLVCNPLARLGVTGRAVSWCRKLPAKVKL